ncbi:MAG: hypothetical protein QME81_18480 [bacterium]|nr:hypothetical protein [bacterium]
MKKAILLLILFWSSLTLAFDIEIFKRGKEEDRAKITVEGEARFRARDVGARGQGKEGDIIDSLGASLSQETTMIERLDIKLSSTVVRDLTVVGVIRTGNEGKKEPEDLDVESREISLRLHRPLIDITAGRFNLTLTPLTMREWDPQDDPTPVSPGYTTKLSGVQADRLDDLLDEERLFEGLKVALQPTPGLELIGFGLRPEGEAYCRDVYGGRIKTTFPYLPAESATGLGLTYLRLKDVKVKASNNLPHPVESEIYGLDFRLPVEDIFVIVGEFVSSQWDKDLLDPQNKMLEGTAGWVGIEGDLDFLGMPSLGGSISYIRVTPDFPDTTATYSAGTYTPNRTGIRLRARYKVPEKKITFDGYYKYLEELEPSSERGRTLASFQIARGELALDLRDNLSLSGGYEYRRSDRKDDPVTKEPDIISDERIDWSRGIFSLEGIYRFSSRSTFKVRAEFIDHQDEADRPGQQADYQAAVISAEFRLRF